MEFYFLPFEVVYFLGACVRACVVVCVFSQKVEVVPFIFPLCVIHKPHEESEEDAWTLAQTCRCCCPGRWIFWGNVFNCCGFAPVRPCWGYCGGNFCWFPGTCRSIFPVYLLKVHVGSHWDSCAGWLSHLSVTFVHTYTNLLSPSVNQLIQPCFVNKDNKATGPWIMGVFQWSAVILEPLKRSETSDSTRAELKKLRGYSECWKHIVTV